MKASFAIPTYRRPAQLRRAIESVLSQTEKNFELVISDNASGDETEEVVRSYQDSRICYFKNERNLGGPENMKRCVERCTGDWFVMVSDDDALLPDYLMYLKEGLKKSPEATVFSTAYLYGGEAQGILGKSLHYCAGPWIEVSHPLKEAVVMEGLDLIFTLSYEATVMHPVTALKKSALMEGKGYFTEFMYGSDLITFARAAAKGKVVYDFRPGGWYHSHAENWSRSISKVDQLYARSAVNSILWSEWLEPQKFSMERGIELLKRIPGRDRWRWLIESYEGGYPEKHQEFLVHSLAQDKGESPQWIRARAFLKMKKRVAFQRLCYTRKGRKVL